MSDIFRCGASVGDITPLPEELDGLFALQCRKFGGVCDPLKVRAISVSLHGERILFVCFELDKAPYPGRYTEEIAKCFPVEKDHILFTSVHAHAVPVTGDRVYDGPNNIDCQSDFVRDTTHRYESRIHDIVMKVIGEAVAAERPARMRVGFGESFINVDRRCAYHVLDEEGRTHTQLSLGADFRRPVNRTVTAVEFVSGDGEPIAFLVNYPVHCTVMHGNSARNGRVGISSDIAGRVSTMMEKKFSSSVCMWTSAAAGNINPVLQCEVNYPDPEDGRHRQKMLPGDTTGLLDTVSLIHYRDVLHTVLRLEEQEALPVEKLGNCVTECIAEGRHEPYRVGLHMVRIGETAFLSASGELYASYEEKLKSILPGQKLIVINHDSSNAYSCGYIPDAETLSGGECDLPGVGKEPNIIPQKFLNRFITDSLGMYDRLFYSEEDRHNCGMNKRQ